METIKLRRIVDQNAATSRIVGYPFPKQVEKLAGVRRRVAVWMRPVAGPEAPIGSRRGQRLGEDADVVVAGRPDLGCLIRRRELDPGVAPFEQTKQAEESGVVSGDRL